MSWRAATWELTGTATWELSGPPRSQARDDISRADNFSAKSQFVFVISNPLKSVNGPWRATQNRWGRVVPTREQRSTHSRRRTVLSVSGDAPAGQGTERPLGQWHGGTKPLTCWAALSASSANSTDRPFNACLRDPHVLLFRVAQEGSGVVSDPKALRKREHMRGDTQGPKLMADQPDSPLPKHHTIPGRLHVS